MLETSLQRSGDKKSAYKKNYTTVTDIECRYKRYNFIEIERARAQAVTIYLLPRNRRWTQTIADEIITPISHYRNEARITVCLYLQTITAGTVMPCSITLIEQQINY